MSKQVYKVIEVLRKRITEYRHAKSVLEEIHKQSAQKVNDINKNIADLEKEMMEKEGHVRVCQMRLGSRAHRPISELCNDKVEATLLKEYRTLRETVVHLSQMISEVSHCKRQTLHSILTLYYYSQMQLCGTYFRLKCFKKTNLTEKRICLNYMRSIA